MALKQLGAAPVNPSDVITQAQYTELAGLFGSMLEGGAKTGAFTALPNTHYLINFGAGLGAQAVTLPTTPAQGSVCAFSRADNNVFTSFANITPGGSDTIAGTSTYNLVTQSGSVSFLYVGTAWYVLTVAYIQASGMLGPTSSAAFNPSLMSRDNFGRAQVVDPAAAGDIATKNYVDTAAAAAENTMPITRLLTR